MNAMKANSVKITVLQILTALFPFAQAALLFFGVPCLLNRIKSLGADLPLSTMVFIKQRDMWWALVIAGLSYVVLLKLSPKFKDMKILLGILAFEVLWVVFDVFAVGCPMMHAK